MHAEAVRDQHGADHQQEAQRQHHHGRIPLDEIRHRIRGEQHHQHRRDHRNHHHRQMLGHAHGGQDGIDREDEVQHQDLRDRRAEGHRLAPDVQEIVIGVRIDIVMDFLGSLPHQEQPARDQNQVAPGKLRLEGRLPMRPRRPRYPQVEDGRRQPHQPGDHRQQGQPQKQRQADADAARLLLLMLGQLVGQDRDEDEVVDAEHDLHHHKGDEGRPHGGIGE